MVTAEKEAPSMSVQRTSWVVARMAFATFCGSQTVKADFVFGEATSLGPIVNSPDAKNMDYTSYDGLEKYITSGRPGQYGG